MKGKYTEMKEDKHYESSENTPHIDQEEGSKAM